MPYYYFIFIIKWQVWCVIIRVYVCMEKVGFKASMRDQIQTLSRLYNNDHSRNILLLLFSASLSLSLSLSHYYFFFLVRKYAKIIKLPISPLALGWKVLKYFQSTKK